MVILEDLVRFQEWPILVGLFFDFGIGVHDRSDYIRDTLKKIPGALASFLKVGE